MSTLKTTYLQHPSSASENITLKSDGTIDATLNGYATTASIPESPVYAHARVESNGTPVYISGMTVSRTGTGVYVYTFTTALADTNYSVIATPADSPGTDPNMFVHSFATTGFTLTVASGDNSGTADVPDDFNHSIAVLR